MPQVQRPPPSPITSSSHPANSGETQGNRGNNSSSGNVSQHQSSSQNQTAQSPLDWANFMNFQTPPVNGGYPARGNGGNNGGEQRGEQFQSFAQGIAMRQSASTINFQPPYPRTSSSSSTRQVQHNQQQQYNPGPSPHSTQTPAFSMPSQTPPQLTSPVKASSQAKGKSPASRSNSTATETSSRHNSTSQPQESANNPDNGLTLDPSAFSRDIRFQVPSFLSNQVGGAPTFPPGGEAWSGFSGANFFGSADMGQLTPGTIFANAFGISNQASDQAYCGNENNSERNVLEGLSGFMNGEGGWDNFNNGESGGKGMESTANLGHGLSTMFYVNPNPSPNVLAPRNPPAPTAISLPGRTQGRGNASLPNPSSQQNNMSGNQAPMPSPRNTTFSSQQPPRPHHRNSTAASSHSSSSGSMPTSAILPQQATFPNQAYRPTGMNFGEVPSMSNDPSNHINFASSSSAPYAPPTSAQNLMAGPMPPSLTDGPGLYSTTGFDMVGVLARVAARKDPSTVLGPVDLSCSFLVVDIRRYDSPIVYASPSFSQLTGYELPQILGRNCRFLQSPEGEVVKGSKRKYTDNTAVAHLKRMLNAGKECQASLINYRRGGVPFINLVTVVPIPWDGTDIVYHVGFQVDLVEQPNAILRNMRDGSYQVNYTVSNPIEKPLKPPGKEMGVTGLSTEIVDIMGSRVKTIAGGQGEDVGKMEWLKMVLENTDDFVHALSLKGFFQYVSPSVRRVLEYEPEELLNKNISEFAHPSDIVPLMRELKDSTHGSNDGQSARHVNLVFRIRRKNSGYIWIESVGRLVVEAGKGRKAVILSGRARSVPTLPWDSVAKYGGLAETEFWAKVSFQGLVLHTTSGVDDVLGQPTEDVVGQSFFSLLPGGDNAPPAPTLLQADPTAPVVTVANALHQALSGETRHGGVSVQHKMVHKSGRQLNVVSIFYAPRQVISEATPGAHGSSQEFSSPDASEDSRRTSLSSGTATGLRPTSIVVQVKVLSAPQSTQNQPSTIATLTNARPVVHVSSANLFEELETTRGTSWQYELHQLRLLNRRLKEDIASARSRGAGKLKGKKRKLTEELGVTSQWPSSTGSGAGAGGAAPALPEQYKAAPRHQLAPGFGLVTPGLGSPYY
ncbi:hypothetical protein CI109_101580 [Kwoniella shandongensis]|uniref:Uncharacterized protein n=1 Tax=Kwoniella shandongensis TaxID=1734106 RepID=A0A5M6CAL6_9TREE|nr:uncharacterized protein CI109_001289 [Kwoniella shandongensis]KAA5530485.1 hypothetical protein CI109_001289 [Kwoniella shandongensis]